MFGRNESQSLELAKLAGNNSDHKTFAIPHILHQSDSVLLHVRRRWRKGTCAVTRLPLPPNQSTHTCTQPHRVLLFLHFRLSPTRLISRLLPPGPRMSDLNNFAFSFFLVDFCPFSQSIELIFATQSLSPTLF